MKLPYEIWELNITNGARRKHSEFEKRVDAEKMKRYLEGKTMMNLYTIIVKYQN